MYMIWRHLVARIEVLMIKHRACSKGGNLNSSGLLFYTL